MNKLYCLLLLALSIQVKADTLQVVFRFYDKTGKAVTAENTRMLSNGTAANRVYSSGGDAWQQWQVSSTAGNYTIQLISLTDTLNLAIDVHPDCRNGRAKTVVFSRLQSQRRPQSAKINYLTCKWQGTIAYPLDHVFMNVIDGQTLKLQNLSSQKYVIAKNTAITVLSDSVMLFNCEEKTAVFVKYFLGADGIISFLPASVECLSFNSEFDRDFYFNFIRYSGIMRYEVFNDKLILQAGDQYAEFLIGK